MHAKGKECARPERRPFLPSYTYILSIGAACIIIIAWFTIIPSTISPWKLFHCKHASVSPVDRILQTAPLIDGHNDFPYFIRALYNNDIYHKNFSNGIELPGQVDFPRLRKGGLRGQFWSAYVQCPRNSHNFSDETYQETVHDTFQQIDLVHRLAKEFPQHLRIVSSANDVWTNFANSDTISSFIGVEGLHQIGNSASILRMYHRLGVRYVTLTHSCHNKYADSATPEKPLHNGLSPAGEAMVREMNRLGMIVDLAHVSNNTMRDALRVSSAPVIFSHSSIYARCAHPRNVPNDVLLELKKNGGVIMITFFPAYTRCDGKGTASLSDVADHVQYAGELIGYEHIGLGADFDGMPDAVKGLEDVSKYPDLIAELLRRGVSEKDLQGVVGANVLRVLKEVELEAERLKDVKPLQDEVKKLN
ncbi:membrane dipeptidase [Blastomyces gilchristii SLH14081]|uniref:Dipeptidase n=2 Tax=Blastomyces TaxID=229219 RepID=A0A179UA67_BLAGS|nr:membrane dipeptidase [Blastomyces gilchristii SLH14081]EGE82105.1 membrane dipeptidase [Blastomyces dermatitidis ATCC 18188]OAT04896.1 membrane dipeptidase [Blastomyces gilchristii SLH14081]